MAEGYVDPDLILPTEFKDLPLKALRTTARNKIGQYLDLEGTVVICLDDEGQEIDVSTNYNGLAELAGFDYLEIRNLARHRNPTQELLDQWTGREGYNDNATVGYLWRYLRLMEREDVLKDCRRVILADCKHYKEFEQIKLDVEKYGLEPIQDPTVSSPGDDDMTVDETDIVALDDVQNALDGDASRVQFDAFVSYSIEDPVDRQFVRNMIEQIEFQRGLKLFVPGRDDIPGGAQNTINAFLIEKRCRRVVIVLSRAFLESPVCDFQLKFAQCLAPGARSKRLIPVMREKGTPIPRILKFLAVCDFTKNDMVDWVWDRLGAAIRAPIGPMVTDSSRAELEESLKEVQFPTQEHRLQIDSDTFSGSPRTVASRRRTEHSSSLGSPINSPANIQRPIEAFTERRVSSFGGRSSTDPFVSGMNYSSTPPTVYPSTSQRPPASQPIAISDRQNQRTEEMLPNAVPSEFMGPQPPPPGPARNGRSANAVYPRANFSPQNNEVTLEYSPQAEMMSMSVELPS